MGKNHWPDTDRDRSHHILQQQFDAVLIFIKTKGIKSWLNREIRQL